MPRKPGANFKKIRTSYGIKRNGDLAKITNKPKDGINRFALQMKLLNKRKFVVRREVNRVEKKLKLADTIINRLEREYRDMSLHGTIKERSIDSFKIHQIAKYRPSIVEYKKVAMDAKNYAKLEFLKVYQEYLKKTSKKINEIDYKDITKMIAEFGERTKDISIYGDRTIINIFGQKSTKRKAAGL